MHLEMCALSLVIDMVLVFESTIQSKCVVTHADCLPVCLYAHKCDYPQPSTHAAIKSRMLRFLYKACVGSHV